MSDNLLFQRDPTYDSSVLTTGGSKPPLGRGKGSKRAQSSIRQWSAALSAVGTSMLVSLVNAPTTQAAWVVPAELHTGDSQRANDPVEIETRWLAKRWRQEGQLFSSVERQKSLESYKKLLALGNAAIPFLLDDISESPSFLFVALADITGEDPVLQAHWGNARAMCNDWLSWGAQNGYVRT